MTRYNRCSALDRGVYKNSDFLNLPNINQIKLVPHLISSYTRNQYSLTMKAIFSALAIAALSSVISAVPTKRQALSLVPASYNYVVSQAQPDVDEEPTAGGPNVAVISRTNGNNDIDTIVNFDMPDISQIPGATPSSTCSFVIYNVAALSGSETMQLYTLNEFVDLYSPPVTWNSADVQSVNQNYGTYQVFSGATTGPSVAIDGGSWTFPCQFGQTLQFLMRPEGQDDYITWSEGGGGAVLAGAYIQVNS